MKRISMWKAVIAVAVALAFILPSAAAFANVGTIKVTSGSKNTVDVNNNIGGTSMSDTPRDDTILTEKTVVPAVLLSRGTVYVDDNAPPEWYNATHVHTIQQGVTNATAGDTVYVYNGTYREKVNVTKRLSLVGESRENVIVNGSGSGNVFYITTPVTKVNISTFSIKNGQYGIQIYKSSNNSITNCNVYSNTLHGIYIFTSSNNSITNCNVYRNTMHSIYIFTNSYDNKITNCNAYNNTGGSGIYVRTNSNNNVIMNCNAYNTTAYGIYLYASSNNNITNCNAYKNTNGIQLSSSSTNNNIMNCNAYNNSQHGIYVTGSSTNNITNCNAYNNKQYGIYIKDSLNNNIMNCNVYNNKQYGIWLSGSSNNNLNGNTIYDNVFNFVVTGTTLGHFTHVIAPTNTINGKRIYYLVNAKNTTLNETNNFGYLGLVSCTNITAKNADVSGILVVNTTYSTILNVSSHNSANSHGIYLWMASNNNIMNCNVYNNSQNGIYVTGSSHNNNIMNCNVYNNTNYGIYLYGSSNNNITNCNVYKNSQYGIFAYMSSHNNNITNCNVYNNYHGIYCYTSLNNDITNCNVYNNRYYGIYLGLSTRNNNIMNCNAYNNTQMGIFVQDSSRYNNITNCNAYKNQYGIYLYSSSSNNNITNCNAYNNTNYGIYIKSSSNNNLIHHNNFINNVQNAYDAGSNQWDDGSEGNYWSDYTGVDADHNGIGDTPYNISGKTPPNQDRYPLMAPIDVIPPVITAIQATPALQNTTRPVNITCTVTDNWNLVDTVKINITGPAGFTLDATMNKGSYYYYNHTYTAMGIYFYHIRANDTSGNVAVSGTYTFVITEFEKPISAVNPLPLWKKAVPFTIAATAYDNTGVANVTLWSRYSSNGTSWTAWTSYGTDFAAPWSWSFTGVNGYYQFYSIAVDIQSNVEDPPSSADASTGIDTIKPVTTILLNGTMGENGWYVSNVIVTLSATDTLSGIESRWYKVDAGYWTIYTVPFTVSGDGVHTVQYYSFDHAGNQEAANSVSFKIDKIAPTTTHTLQGLLGSQGWYVTNVTVTLSANDVTSGVNYTKYKINTGDWIVYTGSFVVTTDGNYTLYYCSVDFAGNTEATKQAVFRIRHDVLPPVTTHTFSGTMGNNNWFVSTVTVMLSAVDDSAGVASTKYKLDAGNWTTYTGAFLVIEDAEHTLYYYSVDIVGNREENKSVTLKIDRTPPTINLTVQKTGLMKWLLTANVSDETSGVAKVEFYVDGEFVGEVTEAPYELEYSGTGDTAQAIVYDNASNHAISAEVKDQSVSDSQSQSSSSTLVSVSQSVPQSQSSSSTLQRLFNLR